MTGDLAVRTAAAIGNDGRSIPSVFLPVLEWLCADPARLGVVDVGLEPVCYQERPFSHLLKVAVRVGAVRRDTHLFVKIFKSAGTAADVERMRVRVARDFEQTRQIHAAMSGTSDLAVVRPVACSPEHLATVTEEAPGGTLLEYLQAQAAWLGGDVTARERDATMVRVGRWIRAFQATGGSAPREQLSVESLRSYVDIRLAKLTALPAAGFSAGDRERVLAHIDRLGAAADPIDLDEVPVHNDLAPGNVLVSDERITVLDFAMVGTGSRLHDVSRLWLQIELMALKPQFRTAVLEQANRSLLRGFDGALDRERPMFRLLSMLHRVNHLATLATSRAAFPSTAYNWHVRRHHRAWIARELRRPVRNA